MSPHTSQLQLSQYLFDFSNVRELSIRSSCGCVQLLMAIGVKRVAPQIANIFQVAWKRKHSFRSGFPDRVRKEEY